MNDKIIIGVIGSGAMGSGIAQVAATAGHQVLLYDNNAAALEKALKKLKSILDRLVEKGKITAEVSQEIFGRIQPISDLKEFAPSEMIIEAIIEDLGIKKKVFAEIESVVSESTILASNTSSLSIASIGSSCKKPERFIGIHFFNPAPLMPLVEIIPSLVTNSETLGKSRSIIDSWKKVTVLAKDTPGFIVNRLARPFYGEAIRIYEEGRADFSTIDWAMKEIGGFRMGPFELMDYIGNDINYTVTETVFKEFFYDSRYKPSFTQKRLFEAGFLGRKSGRGYYDYSENSEKPKALENEELGQYIVDRIVAMLVNEAADALFLNIATREDLDLAMTKGVNYPKGLLSWADEIGIKTCLERLELLQQQYGEDRYRPSYILKRMVTNQETFYA